MNTVKTRKVGNSLTVTIPKNLGMTEGQEMVVYKGIDGVIVLAPKLKDPFDGITDLRMTNDFEGVRHQLVEKFRKDDLPWLFLGENMPCKLVLWLSVPSLMANNAWQKKACSFLSRRTR